ncbi:uncharacterized protein BO88DRAFT_109976 [Aspergillus vadensis CBS 113365]|uniref:Uncharacterized protein n=1 Tax=Aspergillus vadensis (strain CBS 113365 / IMI 142717 / IBT 24658) TaxID=1448311 RepID=A0A319CF87_ASPVC|nr:hypothetical protein BO88DRAFT_109976 [Aspergillus vadensis CBS 113365]PYH73978.1 hypothetical protein BO88DRAFT_109976 [Aspergillus vadensis CBS 113365]
MSFLFQPQPFPLSLSACSLLNLPRASLRKPCLSEAGRTHHSPRKSVGLRGLFSAHISGNQFPPSLPPPLRQLIAADV